MGPKIFVVDGDNIATVSKTSILPRTASSRCLRWSDADGEAPLVTLRLTAPQ
ncbi:hypothetical protein V6L77_15380 [Pannonibacter sp. Pt2-lr]